MIYLFIILITLCTYQIGYSCATQPDKDQEASHVTHIDEQNDITSLFDACTQAFLQFVPHVDMVQVSHYSSSQKSKYLTALDKNEYCIAAKKAFIALGKASIEQAAQFTLWALQEHPHVFACITKKSFHEDSQALSRLCKSILENSVEKIAQKLIDHKCLQKIVDGCFINKYEVRDILKDKAQKQCLDLVPHENSAFHHYLNHFIDEWEQETLIKKVAKSALRYVYADCLFNHGTPKERLFAEDLLLRLLFEVEPCKCVGGELCSTHIDTLIYKNPPQTREQALHALAMHMPSCYGLVASGQSAFDWYNNTHALLRVVARYERQPNLDASTHLTARPDALIPRLAAYVVKPPASWSTLSLHPIRQANALFGQGIVRDALLEAMDNFLKKDFKITNPGVFFQALEYISAECYRDSSSALCSECMARNDAILDSACAKLVAYYWHKWYKNQDSLSWLYKYPNKQDTLDEKMRIRHVELRTKQRTIFNHIEHILALSAYLTQHNAVHHTIMNQCSYDYQNVPVDTGDIEHLSNIARYAPAAYQKIRQAIPERDLESIAQTLLDGNSDRNLMKKLPDDLQPEYVLQHIYSNAFQRDKQEVSKYLRNSFSLKFLLEKLEPSHHHGAVYPFIISCAQTIAQHYPEHLELIEKIIKKHEEHTQCPIKDGIEHWYTRLLDKGSFLTIAGHKTPKLNLSSAAEHTLTRIVYLIDPTASKKRIRRSAYKPYRTAPSESKKADAIINMFAKSISPQEYEVACKALLNFTQARINLDALSAQGETEYSAYCNAFTRLIEDVCTLGYEHNSSHMYRIIKRIVRRDASFQADQSYVHDMLTTYVASPLVPDTHKYEALSLLFNLSGSIELIHSKNVDELLCTQWKTAHAGQHFASWYQLLRDAQNTHLLFKERIKALHGLSQMPHAWQLVEAVCKQQAQSGQAADKLIWAASDCFTHAQQSDSTCIIALYVLNQMPEHYNDLGTHLKPYEKTTLKKSAVDVLFAQEQSATNKQLQA